MFVPSVEEINAAVVRMKHMSDEHPEFAEYMAELAHVFADTPGIVNSVQMLSEQAGAMSLATAFVTAILLGYTLADECLTGAGEHGDSPAGGVGSNVSDPNTSPQSVYSGEYPTDQAFGCN
jgi:hypothetical protein